MAILPLVTLRNGTRSGRAVNQAADGGEPKPFFKKFKTKRNFYAYDANTGIIVQLNHSLYELLDCLTDPERKEEITSKLSQACGPQEVDGGLALLNRMIGKVGVFRPVSLRTRTVRPEIVRAQVHKMVGHLGHLVLSVSEQCNLRCSYCSFSGGYANSRVHNDTHMSWEVARKAIDYFLANLGSTKAEVGFYGGEPLLNLPLVKQCVSYTKETNPSIVYGMTTNGTLLSDTSVDYLVDAGIRLLISLDGPEEVHDKERGFISGRPSFEKILDNVKRLKARYPQFYEKK